MPQMQPAMMAQLADLLMRSAEPQQPTGLAALARKRVEPGQTIKLDQRRAPGERREGDPHPIQPDYVWSVKLGRYVLRGKR